MISWCTSPSFGHQWVILGHWNVAPGHLLSIVPPIIFKFHLPTKLQDKIFPSHGDRTEIEDFFVAYDGMVFMACAETDGRTVPKAIGPTVRAYLQRELFKSIGDFTPAVIPPSPMHLTIHLDLHMLEKDLSEEQFETTYEATSSTIKISARIKDEFNATELLKDLYDSLRTEMHIFYHVMTLGIRAQDLHSDILRGSQLTYSKYADFLGTTKWNIPKRVKLASEMSSSIGHLHHVFCEHSLALAQLQERRRDLSRYIGNHTLFKLGEEYFNEQTKPETIDYSVFLSSLGHMRSHLFVLSQNRSLFYAALLGALATLAGTAVGFLLAR